MFLGWEKVERHQVLQHLIELQVFFQEESKWIFWPKAADIYGKEVTYDSNRAVKWSLIAASELIAEKNHPKPLCDFVDCAARDFVKSFCEKNIPETYEEEYLAICKAIEKLKND